MKAYKQHMHTPDTELINYSLNTENVSLCVCVMCIVFVEVVHWLVPGTGGHLLIFEMYLKSDGENRIYLFSIFLIVGGQPLAI